MKEKWKIVADSSADLLTLSDVPFKSVALKIGTADFEYVDDATLDVEEMMTALEGYSGKSGSSCPSVGDYLAAFGESEQIFCVTITRGLSGSYNAAMKAASDYRAANPERRVYVIDTLSTGPECTMLIEKLQSLILADLSFDEIVDKINEYKRQTHLIFALESLKNLANNGRVNSVVAKLAGILGIRVVGQASTQGTLEISAKVRGGEKAIAEIMKVMDENGYQGGVVRIHHADNPRAALVLKKRIKALYPDATIKVKHTRGLCSFYAERGGLLVGYEGKKKTQERITE